METSCKLCGFTFYITGMERNKPVVEKALRATFHRLKLLVKKSRRRK